MIHVDVEAKQLASSILDIAIKAHARGDQYPEPETSLACYNLSAQEIGSVFGALAGAYDEDLTELVQEIDMTGCDGSNALQELLCEFMAQIAPALVAKGYKEWN